LAAWFGPFGPNEPPVPTDINVNPRPDFAFLWMFAVLALLTPQVEDFLLITAMPVALVFLLAIPFISNQGERAPSKRPLSVLCVVLIFMSLAVLSVLGVQSPWSPHMTAWSEDPTPPNLLEGRSPLEFAGAVVLQNSQCRNCHALDGVGGQRGPDLTDVATRLSHDQIVRQVQQGGGNMPAYGRSLTAAETQAVAVFLDTMHPGNERGAFIPGAEIEALKKLR
jgi:ubiquinol-cytochrome c reductase cytochrome b subunit